MRGAQAHAATKTGNVFFADTGTESEVLHCLLRCSRLHACPPSCEHTLTRRRVFGGEGKRRRQRGFVTFDAQSTTLVPERNLHFSTSTRIRTLRCTEHHSGARTQNPNVDVSEDSHLSMHRTPLWCSIATSILRPPRGPATFDAQSNTLVRDRTLQTSTSTRIGTLRCTEHHPGARSHIPNVDVNEDSHPSMHRTPLWCAISHSKRRRQRGFAPFDAQNTTLVPNRTVHRM